MAPENEGGECTTVKKKVSHKKKKEGKRKRDWYKCFLRNKSNKTGKGPP